MLHLLEELCFKMNNKYRLAYMIVIIMMLFMYFVGFVTISCTTNFAFTCAALVLSVSMSIESYAKKSKIIKSIIYILEIVALLIVVMIPNVKDELFIQRIMKICDTNVLLLLALFFTFASQWAAEIKWNDMQNRKGENMYSNKEYYQVILRSASDINMSNW